MAEKLSKELAEQEFYDYADILGIDCDTDSMNDEDRTEFNKLKNPVVKAIRDGRCIVDGKTLQYTIENCDEAESLAGKVVTIAAPRGRIYSGLDGYKDTQNIKRMNSAMSAMTGLDIGIFPKLDIKDYSFFKSVVTLFLSI